VVLRLSEWTQAGSGFLRDDMPEGGERRQAKTPKAAQAPSTPTGGAGNARRAAASLPACDTGAPLSYSTDAARDNDLVLRGVRLWAGAKSRR